jgi:hypothetical protein
MDFQFIVITIASFILVITLIIAYFNIGTTDKQFPRAMTNCPDYWEINLENGNCIIPSEDKPNANIGNLKGHGEPYYIYNNNNKLNLTTQPNAKNAIAYTPYDDENYKVYSYSTLNIPAYTDLSMNPSVTAPNYVSISNSINIIKDNNFTVGNEINFNDNMAWFNQDKGNSSICNIKKWVNSQNIVWDGIHNYNKCS